MIYQFHFNAQFLVKNHFYAQTNRRNIHIFLHLGSAALQRNHCALYFSTLVQREHFCVNKYKNRSCNGNCIHHHQTRVRTTEVETTLVFVVRQESLYIRQKRKLRRKVSFMANCALQLFFPVTSGNINMHCMTDGLME